MDPTPPIPDWLNTNASGGVIPVSRFFELATDDYCIAPNLEPHPTLDAFRIAIDAWTQDGARVFCEVADVDDGAALVDALLIATTKPLDAFAEFATKFGADGVQPANRKFKSEAKRMGLPNAWRIPWD